MHNLHEIHELQSPKTIHAYENNGFYIVLDVNSGAVHNTSDVAYRLIQLIDEMENGFSSCRDNIPKNCPQPIADKLFKEFSFDNTQEIDEIYNEIVSLIEDDQLFSRDDKYEKIAEKMVLSPLKALCLHVSHDCNLRCRYCFAGEGDYGGKKMVMNFETAKAAVDFLIKHSSSRHNLEVDFFGGEPLLNLAVVKETVAYARSIEKKHDKNFRFTMTTNGVLMDAETSVYLNDEMDNVVLSLDGRREINDMMRPKIGKQGSYDSIVPHYKYFVSLRSKTDKDYYVRGTFTKNNLDFSNDVLHMAELGFEQLSVEPVVGDSSLPYALTETDLPIIFKEYDKLAKILIDKKQNGEGFNFFHFMIDLEQGPCVIKRMRGCGCGNEYAAIDPEGDVYPCHQFVGKNEWIMGNVFTGDYNLEFKKKFAKATVYDKLECRKCWAKFYCSGGCNANNQEYAGDILTPHTLSCELEKKRLECAIMVQIALAE